MRQRRSFWRVQLDQARSKPGWHMIPRYYTRTTAMQIASDIRNGRRIAGVKADELWTAEWLSSDDRNEDHLCRILIMLEASNADS